MQPKHWKNYARCPRCETFWKKIPGDTYGVVGGRCGDLTGINANGPPCPGILIEEVEWQERRAELEIF